jgi:hypothetical protein
MIQIAIPLISSPGDLHSASEIFDRLIQRQVMFGGREGEPRIPGMNIIGGNMDNSLSRTFHIIIPMQNL